MAAIAISRITVRATADAAGLNERYLHQVIAGNCPMSARVRQALQDSVGPEGWAFAIGATEYLPTPAPKREA